MRFSKNKICIIGVYFGVFPNYISLWLKSCEYNPEIDFLIFSDSKLQDCPENVRVVSMTLNEIKERASKELGFECVLDRPYKLCDYKPLYGIVFKDYLADYDYWGHCDFDLIFGDLKGFFDRYELYKYDRFHALGHLSLYRNTDEVNGRYKCEGSAHNYKETFITPESCVFDEMPGMTAIYLKNGFPFFTDNIYIDIASVYDRYRIIEEYALDKKTINYPQQIFYWENGKCYRAFFDHGKLHEEEYQYIHFKKRANFEVKFDTDKENAFYITKYGFIPKHGAVTEEIIGKYNPYRGELFERFEFYRYMFKQLSLRIKRKIKVRD